MIPSNATDAEQNRSMDQDTNAENVLITTFAIFVGGIEEFIFVITWNIPSKDACEAITVIRKFAKISYYSLVEKKTIHNISNIRTLICAFSMFHSFVQVSSNLS